MSEPKTASADQELQRKVEFVIDEMIRPALQSDGGDIEVVSVKDGTLTVHLQGACHGCPSATYTLRMGIETLMREQVPEVREIVHV